MLDTSLWLVIVGAVAILVIAGLKRGARNYRAWMALGPGGVPHNIFGWLIVSIIRPIGGDSLDCSGFEAQVGAAGDRSFLADLPTRGRGRPTIAYHLIPHRQTDQIGNETILRGLADAFGRIVEEYGSTVENKLSQYEKRHFAIWLKDPQGGNPLAGGGGEIAHFHPSDGSMHAILSPSDAKAVITRGWGELHRLARFQQFFPTETYVLIYSPTTPRDLGIVKQIIEAAVKYALPAHELDGLDDPRAPKERANDRR